jgi:hypothetical protein
VVLLRRLVHERGHDGGEGFGDGRGPAGAHVAGDEGEPQLEGGEVHGVHLLLETASHEATHDAHDAHAGNVVGGAGLRGSAGRQDRRHAFHDLQHACTAVTRRRRHDPQRGHKHNNIHAVLATRGA